MTSAGWTAEGRPLLSGFASGEALVLAEPLSFWGGVSSDTGVIIDTHHPQVGRIVAGRVLALPRGRGSSSSSSVLAECLLAGTGPVAILLGEPDPILLLGALVMQELSGSVCPVVVIGELLSRLRDGDHVSVHSSGAISVDQAAGTNP